MKKSFFIFSVLLMLLCCETIFAAKLVTIRLTGTAYEDVVMKVGRNGRTEFISDFPFEFQVSKTELPIKLTFESENYTYTPITVPVKPVDDIGHVYIVKGERKSSMQYYDREYEPAPRKADSGKKIKGIDTTHGVNAAPVTGKVSEKTFALIIANEEYEMASHVANATNDGLAFKEYCIKTFGMKDSQIKYVPNATVGKMKKGINEIKNIAKAYNGDINLLVFYAGHGIPDNATRDAYLMPVDADGTDMEVCFSLKKFYAEIDAMGVNQAVVFMDACFSGSQRDGDMIVAARGVSIKPKEEKPKGKTIVFSATSGEETAFSYDEQKHGLFTYFLLKKLQESKGKTNLGELADYIQKNVGQQSIIINQKKQTPTVTASSNLGNDWRKFKISE